MAGRLRTRLWRNKTATVVGFIEETRSLTDEGEIAFEEALQRFSKYSQAREVEAWLIGDESKAAEFDELVVRYAIAAERFLILRRTPQERKAWWSRALRAAEAIGAVQSIAECQVGLGRSYEAAGEFQLALDCLQAAASLLRPKIEGRLIIGIRCNTAGVLARLGRLGDAQQLVASLLQREADLTQRERFVVYCLAGWCCRKIGCLEEAYMWYVQAEQSAANSVERREALGSLGSLCRHLNPPRFEESIAYLNECITIAQTTRRSPGRT